MVPYNGILLEDQKMVPHQWISSQPWKVAIMFEFFWLVGILSEEQADRPSPEAGAALVARWKRMIDHMAITAAVIGLVALVYWMCI